MDGAATLGPTDTPRPLLDVQAEWRALRYRVPDPPADLPESPAIYCWRVGDTDLYVGETQSLRSRIPQYVTPGPRQQANSRLGRDLGDAVRRGCSVRLSVLRSLTLNGQALDLRGLTDPAFREQAEECWKIWARGQGYNLWNR